jgi:hypothetical protein
MFGLELCVAWQAVSGGSEKYSTAIFNTESYHEDGSIMYL